MNAVYDKIMQQAIERMKLEEDKKFLAAIGRPVSPDDVKLAQAVIEKSMNDPKTVAEIHRLTKAAAEAVVRADSRLYDLINSDLLLYGSCFILTTEPFKREFRCQGCRTAFGSIRGFSAVTFSTASSRFFGRCSNCDDYLRIDIADRPNDSEPKRQVCLSPLDVARADRAWLWKIPESLIRKILAADPAALSFLPMTVLAAIISQSKQVLFASHVIQQFQAAPDQPVVQSADDPYRNIAKRTGLSQ